MPKYMVARIKFNLGLRQHAYRHFQRVTQLQTLIEIVLGNFSAQDDYRTFAVRDAATLRLLGEG